MCFGPRVAVPSIPQTDLLGPQKASLSEAFLVKYPSRLDLIENHCTTFINHLQGDRLLKFSIN